MVFQVPLIFFKGHHRGQDLILDPDPDQGPLPDELLRKRGIQGISIKFSLLYVCVYLPIVSGFCIWWCMLDVCFLCATFFYCFIVYHFFYENLIFLLSSSSEGSDDSRGSKKLNSSVIGPTEFRGTKNNHTGKNKRRNKKKGNKM